MKVFVGGSRKIIYLDPTVIDRLENIVGAGGTILIGDANGVDKSVQRFLNDINYKNVIVYYVGDSFRNNIGSWETQNIACDSKKKDFYFFTCKDVAMSDDANYGFMIWDGISKGTINNAVNLLRADKKVLIFNSKKREFFSLKTMHDLRILLGGADFGSKQKLITDLKISELYDELPQPAFSYN